MRITTGESDHINPRIRDGKIVWQDNRANTGNKYRGCENCPEYNWDIYLYDISAGVEQAIATGPTMECEPDVSGGLVVWTEYRDLNNADILMKDLDTGKVTKVAGNTFHQWQPRVDNGYVVWTDESRGHSINDVNTDFANADVLLYDTRTGNTTPPGVKTFAAYDLFGLSGNGDEKVAYMWAWIEEYGVEPSVGIGPRGGGSFPLALILKEENGNFTVTGDRQPGAGSN